MALKKLVFKGGVNRENTRYFTENIWYECDKIRFRSGTPEKIGGWQQISTNTYLGVCRSLHQWSTLSQTNYIGVGTNLKFYVSTNGFYYDITPIRVTTTLGVDPFVSTGTTTITVNALAHGAVNGDFVTFSGATGTYATTWNQEYQITYVDVNTYTITVASAIPAGSYGGAAVSAKYQINTGSTISLPSVGWSAGGWGLGPFGVGVAGSNPLRLWSQGNFGENLVYAVNNGGIYYWVSSGGTSTRGVNLTSIGDSSTPSVTAFISVSDIYRFVLAFGCNDYGSSTQDPMLIRWGDQESVTTWAPQPTNKAGSLRLSHGSKIVAYVQSRQEIVVFTDTSVYALQYVGVTSGVWGATLLGDNISIMGLNAAVLASGVTYWMGYGKFYKYDGRIQTLVCDIRKYIFDDINLGQAQQICAGSIEQFNEVWWFYCSTNSTVIDKYAVYNYAENIWYYGTMARSAWLDAGIIQYPIAATYTSTRSNNLVYQEYGLDDNTTAVPAPIYSYIASAEFDIEDGDKFSFIWRIVPDVAFVGAIAASPQATMTLAPLNSSGSGYTTPPSVGSVDYGVIKSTQTYPIEKFTEYLYIRVRGRQLVFKIENNQLGGTFQLGAPRIDIRTDGRRA